MICEYPTNCYGGRPGRFGLRFGAAEGKGGSNRTQNSSLNSHAPGKGLLTPIFDSPWASAPKASPAGNPANVPFLINPEILPNSQGHTRPASYGDLYSLLLFSYTYYIITV